LPFDWHTPMQEIAIRYATNYSPQAAALVDEGVIDIDVFKCPAPWDPVVREHRPGLVDEARAVRPVYVHFPLNVLNLAGIDWRQVDEALLTTETAYVNVHLFATTADFPDIDAGSVDDVDCDRVAEAMIEGAGQVAARYGAGKVIGENVVYGGPRFKVLRACTEPSVIRRVVDATACGLLLDLAHARLTCDVLQSDVRAYVEALPVGSLRELHVTGTGHEDRLQDSMPMNDGDWDLVRWAGERLRREEWSTPPVMAFEYGGIGPVFDWRSDPAVIAAQWPKVRAALKRAREQRGILHRFKDEQD